MYTPIPASDDTTPSTRSYYQGRRSGISISYISNPGELMTCQVSLALVAAAPAMSAGGGEVPAAAVRPQAALIPELVPPVVPAGLTGESVLTNLAANWEEWDLALVGLGRCQLL